MQWLGHDGSLWVFGGYGYVSTVLTQPRWTSDLWRYDRNTREWTWMHGPNLEMQLGIYGTQGVTNPLAQPGARHTATTWTDRAGDLWMFGGRGPLGRFNDLWRYDMGTGSWTWMKGANTTGQAGFYGVYVPGRDFHKLGIARILSRVILD